MQVTDRPSPDAPSPTHASNNCANGPLVSNKGSVPYKSILGEKSLTWRSSLFLRREVRTVLATPSLLSVSHFKRYWGSDKCGVVFRSIDDLPSCFCMRHYLCLELILSVVTPVAGLWRGTCKPYLLNDFSALFVGTLLPEFNCSSLAMLSQLANEKQASDLMQLCTKLLVTTFEVRRWNFAGDVGCYPAALHWSDTENSAINAESREKHAVFKHMCKLGHF